VLGVLVGLGTGSMALALVATVTGRWFVSRRGLVSGDADRRRGGRALVFLPGVAIVSSATAGGRLRSGTRRRRWRSARSWCGCSGTAADLGVLPYGAVMPSVGHRRRGGAVAVPKSARAGGAARAGHRRRTRPFWTRGRLLICGATTMGLVQPHFIPAAHDHGMPQTVAAGLLAMVGLFDIIGTIASGWLTDRFDPRYLLLAYYVLRGFSLMALPLLFGPDISSTWWPSSCSTGWTGWPPSRRPWRSAGDLRRAGSGGVRLGVRQPPGRCGADGAGRRHRPRRAGRLRPGLVHRRRAGGGRGLLSLLVRRAPIALPAPFGSGPAIKEL
jgi:hypothetical protein